MSVLTITKGDLYQKYFSNRSRTSFSKMINLILPDEMKNEKTLFPKHLRLIKEELGIEGEWLV